MSLQFAFTCSNVWQINSKIEPKPAVSPGGKKIAFSQYSARGYDLMLMDLNPDQWKNLAQSTEVIDANLLDIKNGLRLLRTLLRYL